MELFRRLDLILKGIRLMSQASEALLAQSAINAKLEGEAVVKIQALSAQVADLQTQVATLTASLAAATSDAAQEQAATQTLQASAAALQPLVA